MCSPRHLVTHFGHAKVTGRTDEAFAHLRAVAGMTQAQAWNHVRTAEDLWIERSRRVWELDLRSNGSRASLVGAVRRRAPPADVHLPHG